jgi:hypothetical protein
VRRDERRGEGRKTKRREKREEMTRQTRNETRREEKPNEHNQYLSQVTFSLRKQYQPFEECFHPPEETSLFPNII